MCELLFEEGKANIEETTPIGNNALNLAASKGHASTVALLLSKEARDGFTPLLPRKQRRLPDAVRRRE